MKLNKKTAAIIFCSAIAVLLFSCDFFQDGQQLYEAGLKHMRSADHECYHDKDELSEAISCFDKAISKGYKERTVFQELAHCYLLNGDTENAEDVYSRALEYFPGDAEFYFRRGHCRKIVEKYKLAYEDFNQAIILDTSLKYTYISDAFYQRGAMNFILGNKIKAEEDRQTAQLLGGRELRTYEDYCKP